MQPPEQTPEQASDEAPPAPADLSRLHIQRDDGGAGTPRGFPWMRAVTIVGLGALLFLFKDPLIALVSGGGASVRTARATRVVPGQAQQGDVAANGYIVADVQASLATVLSGRLVELHAKEGDTVEAGMVVARIQYDDLEVQERQAATARASAEARLRHVASQAATARARVAEAQSDWETAQLTADRLDVDIAAQARVVDAAREESDFRSREVERNRSLFQKRRIDPGTWDEIQTRARTAVIQVGVAGKRHSALIQGKTAWEGTIAGRKAAWNVAQKQASAATEAEAVARAAVAEARQAESLAAIMVEKTRIRAPFEGLVIRKDAEVGEVLAPMGAGNSRGSVLTIVDPTSLEVQVELSERRIARVTEGDRAMIFLDADPEQGIEGTVRKIWPRADRSKGSIELRVTLGSRPAMLRPEMAARVVFKGGTPATGPAREAYVTVPAEAIATRGGQDVVFVVEDDRVRRVSIVQDAREGAAVVVTQGLRGGELVVLAPAAGLTDGSQVKLPK